MRSNPSHSVTGFVLVRSVRSGASGRDVVVQFEVTLSVLVVLFFGGRRSRPSHG